MDDSSAPVPMGDSSALVALEGGPPTEVAPRFRNNRVRPSTSPFKVEEMVADMDPLACLKKPGFCWSGQEYLALSRNCSPCQAGLDHYSPLLHPIMVRCPTGFPSFAPLRDALQALHERHLIFGPAIPKHSALEESSDAANSIRIMTKHIYNLARQDVTASYPKVAALIALVQLPQALKTINSPG